MFSQNDSEHAIYLEYNGDKNENSVPDVEEIGIKHLEGDGDFRSEESIELLQQADIVVTNLPFSLFREYVAQLVEYDKKFFLDKHNLDQFAILGSNRGVGQDPRGVYGRGSLLNGKEVFKRLFIKHKRI